MQRSHKAVSESQSFCGRVDHHTVVSPVILKGKVILIFYCCYWLWSQYFVIFRGVVKLMFATGSMIDSFEKGEENTYKTEPEKGCLFKASKVQKLVQAMLDSYLDGASYNAASGSHLSQILSDMVKSKVKEMSPPRYKLVCQVVVGQNRNQGLRVASRCLWDSQHDDFAVAMFQNHSLFTLVIVHGVYCE
uniref:Uncharacterized protein n=1 Tax=Oncorhynchus kisutch TaxID=8019 RepID=A0A8C7J5C6_ONCKI